MLILREKIGFTCGGSIFGANALMGIFCGGKAPLVSDSWMRYEIARLIVDGVGGSRSIIFCRYFLVFCCHK